MDCHMCIVTINGCDDFENSYNIGGSYILSYRKCQRKLYLHFVVCCFLLFFFHLTSDFDTLKCSSPYVHHFLQVDIFLAPKPLKKEALNELFIIYYLDISSLPVLNVVHVYVLILQTLELFKKSVFVIITLNLKLTLISRFSYLLELNYVQIVQLILTFF